MPIRLATEDDIEPMSEIAAQAFWDDELFGELIHPYRQEHPEGVRLYWLALIRKAWNDPASHFLVSTVGEGDSQTVAAWAEWIRKGRKDEVEDPKKKQAEWPVLPPNRAAHPERIHYLERSYDYISHQWSGPREQCWDIALLAVSPHHQGEGHGKKLMQWGIDQATREELPISVISAYGKDKFYNKLGFTIASGSAQDGEGNPLAGLVKGGLIWWKEDHLR
ncbi:hypothetical protein LTR86_000342 [Recurvomyces mirabilis]|nr:hypothetical protein LTR86_000342 [Recurvomyces mirabilis]